MATLRNKPKLAAVTRNPQKEHPRNCQSRNTSVLWINEEYITQVYEEIEGRVTEKLSQEFGRTESHISCALSNLDEILSNPQIRTPSGTVPGTFRKTNVENQGTNEDDSQSDPHPEAGIFRCQTTENFGPEFGHDMVTGVTEEIRNGHDMVIGITEEFCNRHDMVTGITEELRKGHHMVTGVQEENRYRPHSVTGFPDEIRYCSPGTSSRKQKKACSTSQPQFRSENTPATIEANQILLALQQLATNSNSPIFNHINGIWKLPKSLPTTMPIFEGKSKKIELFDYLFQTSLKIHIELTEEVKKNYFHSLMRGDDLQTFKNITSPKRESLGEILTVFRRK